MFFHSVEFYVILTVVAAVIIGFSALPSSAGAVRQHLLAGRIFTTDDANEDGLPAKPSVEFICRDDGTVMLWRRGLEGIFSDGAVSLAVNIKGLDITIEERLTPGGREPRRKYRPVQGNVSVAHSSQPYDESITAPPTPVTDATFVLDFLAPERYFVRYNSESTGLMCKCSLHNRTGITVFRELKH